MTTKQYLITQLKKSGIKLNWFRRSEYNSVWKRPKIIGNDNQRELFKFIFERMKINRSEWNGVKV